MAEQHKDQQRRRRGKRDEGATSRPTTVHFDTPQLDRQVREACIRHRLTLKEFLSEAARLHLAHLGELDPGAPKPDEEDEDERLRLRPGRPLSII
jgi:hypothetical protein